jgi:hypothetical protein
MFIDEVIDKLTKIRNEFGNLKIVALCDNGNMEVTNLKVSGYTIENEEFSWVKKNLKNRVNVVTFDADEDFLDSV